MIVLASHTTAFLCHASTLILVGKRPYIFVEKHAVLLILVSYSLCIFVEKRAFLLIMVNKEIIGKKYCTKINQVKLKRESFFYFLLLDYFEMLLLTL